MREEREDVRGDGGMGAKERRDERPAHCHNTTWRASVCAKPENGTSEPTFSVTVRDASTLDILL